MQQALAGAEDAGGHKPACVPPSCWEQSWCQGSGCMVSPEHCICFKNSKFI